MASTTVRILDTVASHRARGVINFLMDIERIVAVMELAIKFIEIAIALKCSA